MATTTLNDLLLPLLFLLLATTTASSTPAPTPATKFIRSSCRSTRYPVVCEQSLSSYAPAIRPSPRGLASAALAVTLRHAQSAAAFVGRLASPAPSAGSLGPRQAGAVKDCLETLHDGVDRLRRSAAEMGRMGRAGGPAFALHLSNVQTWVSAALTDENTCLDGCAGSGLDPAVRAAIRRRIVGVAQVTSNALALVNKVGVKH